MIVLYFKKFFWPGGVHDNSAYLAGKAVRWTSNGITYEAPVLEDGYSPDLSRARAIRKVKK